MRILMAVTFFIMVDVCTALENIDSLSTKTATLSSIEAKTRISLPIIHPKQIFRDAVLTSIPILQVTTIVPIPSIRKNKLNDNFTIPTFLVKAPKTDKETTKRPSNISWIKSLPIFPKSRLHKQKNQSIIPIPPSLLNSENTMSHFLNKTSVNVTAHTKATSDKQESSLLTTTFSPYIEALTTISRIYSHSEVTTEQTPVLKLDHMPVISSYSITTQKPITMSWLESIPLYPISRLQTSRNKKPRLTKPLNIVNENATLEIVNASKIKDIIRVHDTLMSMTSTRAEEMVKVSTSFPYMKTSHKPDAMVISSWLEDLPHFPVSRLNKPKRIRVHKNTTSVPVTSSVVKVTPPSVTVFPHLNSNMSLDIDETATLLWIDDLPIFPKSGLDKSTKLFNSKDVTLVPVTFSSVVEEKFAELTPKTASSPHFPPLLNTTTYKPHAVLLSSWIKNLPHFPELRVRKSNKTSTPPISLSVDKTTSAPEKSLSLIEIPVSFASPLITELTSTSVLVDKTTPLEKSESQTVLPVVQTMPVQASLVPIVNTILVTSKYSTTTLKPHKKMISSLYPDFKVHKSNNIPMNKDTIVSGMTLSPITTKSVPASLLSKLKVMSVTLPLTAEEKLNTTTTYPIVDNIPMLDIVSDSVTSNTVKSVLDSSTLSSDITSVPHLVSKKMTGLEEMKATLTWLTDISPNITVTPVDQSPDTYKSTESINSSVLVDIPRVPEMFRSTVNSLKPIITDIIADSKMIIKGHHRMPEKTMTPILLTHILPEATIGPVKLKTTKTLLPNILNLVGTSNLVEDTTGVTMTSDIGLVEKIEKNIEHESDTKTPVLLTHSEWDEIAPEKLNIVPDKIPAPVLLDEELNTISTTAASKFLLEGTNTSTAKPLKSIKSTFSALIPDKTNNSLHQELSLKTRDGDWNTVKESTTSNVVLTSIITSISANLGADVSVAHLVRDTTNNLEPSSKSTPMRSMILSINDNATTSTHSPLEHATSKKSSARPFRIRCVKLSSLKKKRKFGKRRRSSRVKSKGLKKQQVSVQPPVDMARENNTFQITTEGH